MSETISAGSSARLRPVTSRQNDLVKELRQAFTQGQAVDGLCAVEGTRLIEEAIRSRLKVQALFIRESAQNKADRLLDQLSKGADAVLLPDDVFDSAVHTEHPQGVAALVKVRIYELESALVPAPALVMVSAGIQDPGNLGTLIRSAEAFGATGIVGLEGSVNHWNPKTVRASAGSIFRLPILRANSKDLLPRLTERSMRKIALVAPREGSLSGDGSSRSPRRLQDADMSGSCALVIGNEGAGIPREIISQIDEFVSIPQVRVESLNAGVAASVALYEAQRQRTAAK